MLTTRTAFAALVLASACLGPASGAAAQAKSPATGDRPDPWPQGGIRLDLGLLRHGESDLMASPLRYHGTALQLGLAYRRIGVRTRFEVAGALAAPRLEAGYPDLDSHTETFIGALHLQWLRRVARRTHWRGFLGGRLDVLIPFRRHVYPPGGNTEQFADVFIPLQVAAAHTLRLSPRMVGWQALAVPVAALVMRSPYTGLKYTPDLTFAPPGRLLGFDHVLGLDRALGAHWSWVAEWRFTVLSYPEPRELTLATHRWTVGLEVRP